MCLAKISICKKNWQCCQMLEFQTKGFTAKIKIFTNRQQCTSHLTKHYYKKTHTQTQLNSVASPITLGEG